MGVFDKIFRRPRVLRQMNRYFELLDGYSPAWTSFEGGVYEMELTRACIHAFANHASKLQPNVKGADLGGLRATLENRPNPFMLTSQFLYKCATILETCNTCYIVPVLDAFDRTVGFYPVMPTMTELVDVDGEPYFRYHFRSGAVGSVELARVGTLVKFYHAHDLHGDDNSVLRPTMQLMATQNQGIEASIKNAASYRFMAKYANFSKGDDLKATRKLFTEQNLASENDNGGLLLFPNTFTDIQQLKSEFKIVDPEQMKAIETRVFDYFGANENVLQNRVTGDDWAAYYEGKIEPFAVQLSQAMTDMTYSAAQRARGNGITWSSNRLQYMTNQDKLRVSSAMFDRGVFSRNDVMDIWNLPHVEGGDKHYIRKEYAEIGADGSLEYEDLAPVSELDTENDAPVSDSDTENDKGGPSHEQTDL